MYRFAIKTYVLYTLLGNCAFFTGDMFPITLPAKNVYWRTLILLIKMGSFYAKNRDTHKDHRMSSQNMVLHQTS